MCVCAKGKEGMMLWRRSVDRGRQQHIATRHGEPGSCPTWTLHGDACRYLLVRTYLSLHAAPIQTDTRSGLSGEVGRHSSRPLLSPGR